MNELIKILEKFSLENAYEIEENDRQFLAISMIFHNLKSKKYFFPIIIINSLIGYQLSWTWEEYWEELADFSIKYNFPWEFIFDEIYKFFQEFLPQSKCNKRLLNMKIPRIAKMKWIFDEFIGKEKYYYDNVIGLQNLLVKTMKQKRDDKTILFAVKMFHYWARIEFWYKSQVPYEIWIPVDSRITKITKIYNKENIDYQDFWLEISRKINIPRIHLDAILWVRCNDFICF